MDKKNRENNQEEIFSKVIRAGKRTYFFDVKQTKAGEPFLNITESIKFFNEDDGQVSFKKFRIFLYKEDFDNFENGLLEALKFARANIIEEDYSEDFEEDTSEII